MREPNGERQPRDPIAQAVHIARIATGEIEDELPSATEIARMGQLALQEKQAKEVA